MNIRTEQSLEKFEFWSGAKDHSFTNEELRNLEPIMSDLFLERDATETEINDLFWFEEEFLCEMLGLDFDEYLERD